MQTYIVYIRLRFITAKRNAICDIWIVKQCYLCCEIYDGGSIYLSCSQIASL